MLADIRYRSAVRGSACRNNTRMPEELPRHGAPTRSSAFRTPFRHVQPAQRPSNRARRPRGETASAPARDGQVLDGEAIVLRPDNTFDFEALRSRQGQAEAILVAYDIMEVGGQDVRPEPLEERRERLARLLSRSNKALRDGIQLSEAMTGDGAAIFRHACWMDLEGIVSKRLGSRYVSGRTRAWLKTRLPDSRCRSGAATDVIGVTTEAPASPAITGVSSLILAALLRSLRLTP